ncbi:putative ensconsin-like [Cocos nucifera]|nr:putative ensconsin-like [Cocos nucifera]
MPPDKKKEAEKRKKKMVTMKAQRKFDNSGNDSADPSQDLLDDWEVVQPLMEGCIIPNITKRMLQIDDEQRMRDPYGAFLELGYHLFTNIEAVILRKTEVAKAVEAAQEYKTEVENLLVEVEHL